MRKKITLRGIVIIVLFLVFGFNVVKQTMAIKRINNDIAEKSEQLNEKKEENRKLQAELERVQSNYDYLEKLARERLGLIKEGEQIILPSEPQE
ncbi:septum formation initiator family protein [Clostridium sp. NSJ-6]|uniref:Septum formation initiator family protein n=1 Tax=Clostridium hominis TaxID=2763036 RepID=A0ABR7DF34_9CLOT|nr:septum formation initiator family protein [Clostridium hominis]MBC5629962.1 septum formation initiator family protein [Clostridium hominis]MDU2673907.1 septum formation initiator family protein [Clostridium sp.]SCJ95197.1 cell division protein FtsB [uncultured Clostridium sp.]